MLTADVRLPLDHFDLEVKFATEARTTGIFGPSGAGKSSLLKVVAGLERRASGVVHHGDDVWLDSAAGVRIPPERRGIGYVPQEGLLFPNQNVRGNLLAGSGRARRNGRSVEEGFHAVCHLLELESLLSRDVSTLSGGERQRVALGRALCSGPRLLLLDEPLASLDLPMRRRVLPFLRRVREEFSIPMILVSHDPVEVQALCDELIVLQQGKILTRGPTRDVLSNPQVFPVARERGFENVLPAVVMTNRTAVSEVRFESIGSPEQETPDGQEISDSEAVDRGVKLVTPPTGVAVGARVLVGIPAREIIVALQQPQGVSAQNVLAAEIVAVEPVAELRLVVAQVARDIPPVIVEVTPQACDSLSLRAGLKIFLIIKTAGCSVYATPSRNRTERGAEGAP